MHDGLSFEQGRRDRQVARETEYQRRDRGQASDDALPAPLEDHENDRKRQHEGQRVRQPSDDRPARPGVDHEHGDERQDQEEVFVFAHRRPSASPRA